MNNIHIPIYRLPLFLEFFYNEMKESGSYNFSKEFIEKNFSITGYCECGETSCATVYLHCNTRVKKYKIDSTPTKYTNHYFTHLYLSKNHKVIEFEYITGSDSHCAIYKHEVYSSVDRIKKQQKIKKKKYRHKGVFQMLYNNKNKKGF